MRWYSYFRPTIITTSGNFLFPERPLHKWHPFILKVPSITRQVDSPSSCLTRRSPAAEFCLRDSAHPVLWQWPDAVGVARLIKDRVDKRNRMQTSMVTWPVCTRIQGAAVNWVMVAGQNTGPHTHTHRVLKKTCANEAFWVFVSSGIQNEEKLNSCF